MLSMTCQAAMLIGKVFDKESNETLIGASIQIVGTNIGVITNFDGEFSIPELKKGHYDILVRYIGYNPVELKNIEIRESEELNIKLQAESITLGDIQVTGIKDSESSQTLFVDRKKATTTLQTIGSKELIQKGISSASSAVHKIAGINPGNSSHTLNIRGLGDRYNQTTLNGFYLPSDNPEYKNGDLSLFQTDMIQSIEVFKLKSAHQSGDLTGASINIRSKQLIQPQTYKLKIGLGTQSIALSESASQNPPLHYNLGFLTGKKWLIGKQERPLSLLVVGKIQSKNNFYTSHSRNTTTTGIIYKDMAGQQDENLQTKLLLGDLNYQVNALHQLENHFLSILSSKNKTTTNQGMRDDFNQGDGGFGQENRQQENTHLLISNQLQYQGTLSKALQIKSGISLSLVNSDEPNRRIHTLSREENKGSYLWTYLKGDGKQQVYNASLKQKNAEWQGSLNYHTNAHSLSWGAALLVKSSDFRAELNNSNILSSPKMTSNHQNIQDYFNQANLDKGYYRISQNKDTYNIQLWRPAVYSQWEWQLQKLTMQVGLRYEYVDRQLEYALNNQGNQGTRKLQKGFILPNLTLKYAVNSAQTLRFGCSKTYTLPQAKELAPFRYYDLNFASEGNQNILPSENYNLDIKWDFTYGSSNLVALAGFYKYISNPIARVDQANAAGVLTYNNISDKAQVAGIELEFKQALLGNNESKHQLCFSNNLSYIYSHFNSTVSGTTQTQNNTLEGSAPWIINADLSYILRTRNIQFSQVIIGNYTSKKVHVIGMQGFKNTLESSFTQLDIVSSLNYKTHWKFKLSCKNLLNPSSQLTREDSSGINTILYDYRKGINVQLGITYTF